MKKIRIGNTVALSWEIFIHDGDEVLPYDLTGKAISVYLINAFATVKIEDFITEDNVLSFTWEGSEQRFAGVYQLTLVENENTDTMLTFDECEAFELVRCSCSDDEDEDTIEKVELSSKLNMVRVYPIVPVIGPNSNWWVDGVDTGKPSTGMSAYEFAKENGYTGTEEEYAAECAAVPTLNEESRVATAAASEAADNADRAAGEARRSATVANSASATATNAALTATLGAENANTAAESANTAAELSMDQIEAVGRYIADEVTPAVEAANNAATTAGTATQKANKAASDATNAAGIANSAADNANTAANRAGTEADRVERGLSQLSSYMSETVSPAVQSAKNAAAEATAAAEQAEKDVEDAIEAFGPAIANKQDQLVSGTNIKTINGNSILGSGNIVIEGGGGGSTVQPDWKAQEGQDGYIKNRTHYVTEISIGTSDYTFIEYIPKWYDSGHEIYYSSKETHVQYREGDYVGIIKIPANTPLGYDTNATRFSVIGEDQGEEFTFSSYSEMGDIYFKVENPHAGTDFRVLLYTPLGEKFIPDSILNDGYLYSNGEKVDMRFTRSLLPVGTSVPANANLNTIAYLKIGKYYCSQNVDAKTVKNCPVNMAFSMEVFNPLGTNVDDETTAEYTYRLRVLTPYDTGIHYMQCCRTSGTPGTWTYDSWYVTPRSKFALASSKNDGSAAIGATNKGVYIDSNGEIKAMSYTIGKSVPTNAVFTDTNTKVTSVGNHYAPAEDEDQQIDAPSGEVVTGIKRDAAGHVVGVVSVPQTGGGGGGIATETDPIFSASAAADITAEDIAEWNSKKGTIEAVDTNESVEDPELEYATTQYVDTAIANAITTVLNTEV